MSPTRDLRRKSSPKNPSTAIMAFVLNPYDIVLNLANKDDRKLFTDGSKGVKAEDVFDGRK